VFKNYNIQMRGVSPLLQHNNQCVNPLNPMKKKISSITSKRKKVDADYEEIARLEFQSGLYLGRKGQPIIPASNLRRMLIEGARKSKDGKQFETGVSVLGDADLDYEGPKELEGLMERVDEFSWTTVVGNQRSSIMRTRPRFEDWSVQFEIEVATDLVTDDMLDNALRHSSRIGICDGRAIGFGKFTYKID